MTELKQKVHNGAVTALTPVGSHLLSGADDGSICLWERKVLVLLSNTQSHFFTVCCCVCTTVLVRACGCAVRVCECVLKCDCFTLTNPVLTSP